MIETPFNNIYGIEDETITMLELRNLFKAIEKGMITHISYCEDINPYKQRSFEISKVVRCKNCKHKEKDGISEGFHYCDVNGLQVTDDWFCADGEPKEGEQE